MRKFITLFLIMSIVTFSFAQKVQDVPASNLKKKITTDYPVNNNVIKQNGDNGLRAYNDTIAFYDFDGALPAGWTNVDNTANNYIWEWSLVGPHGAYTHLTGQPWTAAIYPIASTTSANGFMMFQADNYNTDQSTGLIVTNIVDHDSYIMSDLINCTGKENVIVKFQERFRVCCTWSGTGLWLGVSTDGTTWTDFSVSEGTPINDHSCASDTVTNVAVNISSVAANQPVVYLRWYIQGLSHYYWMVDDVAVVEGAVDDIIIKREYTDFFLFDDGFYKKVPWIQTTAWPIGFRTAVFNNGSHDLTNVILTTDVTKGGVSVFNENSTIEYPMPTYPSLTNDTIYLLGDDFYDPSQGFPVSFIVGTPAATKKGIYTITHTVSMDETDENPIDNSVVSTFEVSGEFYSRNDGDWNNQIAPQDWVGHGVVGDIIGVRYRINDESTPIITEASSISFWVGSRTDFAAPPTIYGNLYLSDGAGGYDLVLQTDLYDITLADSNSWVTIPFIKDTYSEFLIAGNYLAAIEYVDYGGGDGLWIGEDQDTRQVEWATIWSFADAPGDWVYLSNYGLDQTPMIDLNFEIPVTVGDVKNNEIIKIYPNPTTGILNVYGAINSTINIYNVMGQIVYSVENASFNQTIDMSDFSEGNYIVKVISDTKTTTSKVTFVK
ncbi:MAG: T9SS type A sorting domain-containing protein [Bacteroidota bacterium]